jgi:hypothetical protein
MSIPSPAQALWNQRERLANNAERIRALLAAVGRPGDFAGFQWAQVMAFALEFQPDLILELGRGYGNSTCCFLEVARLLGPVHSCRLVSICLSAHWQANTLPRLQPLCPPDWFAPGTFMRRDILGCDVGPELQACQRCLVLWDAHGFEIAEWVLGHLAPQLAGKPHRVVMHDISDLRYCAGPWNYTPAGLWKGENAEEPFFCLGHICSRVAQAISIVDFTTRNQFPLHTADDSLHSEIGAGSQRATLLRELLGEDLFSLQAHWAWFSLNEASGPLTFPPFHFKEQETAQMARWAKWWGRARRLVRA